MVEQHLQLKARFEIKKTLDPVAQVTYYSSWYYAAIHVAASVPALNSSSALSSYFQLPHNVVAEALQFLLSIGMLEKNGDRYSQGVSKLFLGKDSPMLRRHHANWRMRAVHDLDCGLDKNLHFSTVVTVAKNDFTRIQERLIKYIEEIRTEIRGSGEEQVCAFNVDFFELSGRG